MAPTVREIQSHFGFASSFAAQRHLRALERKGALTRSEGKARAVFSSPAPHAIPIFGRIPAGFSISVESEGSELRFLEILPSALNLSRSTRLFALQVQGDSMVGAHILQGDIGIFEQCPPRSGEIVAALIDGEVTLKRLVEGPEGAFLKAENPSYPELHPAHDLVIQGVLRRLIRMNP